MIEPGNKDDLVEGILRLDDEEALSEWLGHNCRAVVEREYSMDLQARRFQALYNDLVRRP